MKLLLHICCFPCTIYPLKILRSEGHEVSGYFYNPNIHPYTEFKKRREAVGSYAQMLNLPVEIDNSYELEEFLTAALALGKDRCLACYRMRLEKAFQKANEQGAEALTTTLLYSRYQRHEAIAEIGNELSEKYALPFLYRNFRDGWKEGQDRAREIGLYRQSYCGCIFSERDRYLKG